MFQKIMVPIDLEHIEQLDKAISTATDLARLYNGQLYFAGVAISQPGADALSPEDHARAMQAFAAQQSVQRGIQVEARTVIAHDRAIDLDTNLQKIAGDIGADLIVMASHVPGWTEYIFASNAGYLASHASISVFVVR